MKPACGLLSGGVVHPPLLKPVLGAPAPPPRRNIFARGGYPSPPRPNGTFLLEGGGGGGPPQNILKGGFPPPRHMFQNGLYDEAPIS